ncbi:MAG TPA: FAD-dependent monooxygenase [Solirubrobacteraceae bacterium]|jgi:2-polyprenyl-6-methoxyphenol hydroxylase-like FAD-dependent oxidoreductase|nr:FAD-dependent monooxygenase [Solirubrobacteraceae bacterium]
MSGLPRETDVLIVGAGPTGLTLAASLALLGVDHVVIDRGTECHGGSRAAGVQPRTLEYLDRLGVADRLVADGVRGRGFRIQDGARTLMRISYDDLRTPYPFLLLVPQQVTEAHLARRLGELGGTVHGEHRFISGQSDFPGVTATVAGPDGVLRAIQARFLVGCDGVHSATRTAAGIGFPGDAPSQLFAVADVRAQRAPEESSDVTFFFSPDGLLLVAPLPGGLHRIAASVAPRSAPRSAGDLDDLLACRGGGHVIDRVVEVVSAATYRVQQRVAERLCDGPVFLAGDAAHTHSPAGGQGMNTGIQDAANLAWKLHEVIAEGAAPNLLASYHRERHPVATALVAFTRQMATLALLPDQAAGEVRNEAVAGAATPTVTAWIANRLSQLETDYAVGRSRTSPSPGERVPPALVPPAGLTWTLAIPANANGHTRAGTHDRLTLRVVDGLDANLLIRPDGYLAAVDVPGQPGIIEAHLAEYALGSASPASR